MTINKEVIFDKDEIATINKFKDMIEDLSNMTEISVNSLVFYLFDCSEDEINKGKHDLEMVEAFY